MATDFEEFEKSGKEIMAELVAQGLMREVSPGTWAITEKGQQRVEQMRKTPPAACWEIKLTEVAGVISMTLAGPNGSTYGDAERILNAHAALVKACELTRELLGKPTWRTDPVMVGGALHQLDEALKKAKGQ